MSSDSWGEESPDVAGDVVEVGEYASGVGVSLTEEVVSGEVESGEDSLEEDIMVLEEGVSPDLPDAVLPVWEPTGNPAVDAALEALHLLADTDVNEHAVVYEQVQASLRATLDELVAEDEPAS